MGLFDQLLSNAVNVILPNGDPAAGQTLWAAKTHLGVRGSMGAQQQATCKICEWYDQQFYQWQIGIRPGPPPVQLHEH
jgi:hypothetical protein